MTFPTESLREWFLASARDLPWRCNPTPYSVWISEVMLQQTQVVTVIPYFTRWMKRFPTIETLANASLDEVIKHWEGLGYYSRVRNIHKASAQFVKEHGGEIPVKKEALQKIKGLGPYTVGAILSFGFRQKEPAVDGNVSRVLARYFGIEQNIDLAKTKTELQRLASDVLPDARPWEVNEALIELGATVCQKKAKCLSCPLVQSCKAKRDHIQHLLPVKNPRAKSQKLYRAVAIVVDNQKVLVEKREGKKIMSGLYEFPFIELQSEVSCPIQMTALFEKGLGLQLNYLKTLPEQTHSFTRFRAHLFPYLLQACSKKEDGWVHKEELEKLPFSSGHRRIARTLRGEI